MSIASALVHNARGAWVLSASQLAWGALQLGFLLPLPSAFAAGLLRLAGMLQGLQSVVFVMLMPDRARQRAEFVRGFNQTLLDGTDLDLVLVGRGATACRRSDSS